ncbi:C2 calcium-dependent domain-containing protein 4C [Betta splendens]|uniref:C2 calcium-dependent domain-containing protein 4C n=1 Tax=Betta splendens TaxID=158456 RepID=A0A6P7NPQ8_BETSP|nr:C2 calcium-dependent domain-containing protein 4C [Betta splendens]
MWLLGKIRENVESVPLELSRYMRKSEEDVSPPSEASLPLNLHRNVLTPDKIPEFCLPPRLRRRSPETASPNLPGHDPMQGSAKPKEVGTKLEDESVAAKSHLPFSAEVYGLAGIYEGLNTRRKESLFHTGCPVYMFDRSISPAPSVQARETNMGKRTLSGFLPLFLSKSLSETGKTESEAPSSRDSTPLSSPHTSTSSLCILSADGRLKGATSCPSLTDSRDDRKRSRSLGFSLTASSSNPTSLGTGSPVRSFPRERLQSERVLRLRGRGEVRLCAELTAGPAHGLSTVRVRVVSAEGLQDAAEQQSLSCAVSACLTPGKLQPQRSATARGRRCHAFNAEFCFTELSAGDLLRLQLRLKVVDKSAAGSLRRGKVIGKLVKPLSQLLSINKQVADTDITLTK